jgi:hypothetical protein
MRRLKRLAHLLKINKRRTHSHVNFVHNISTAGNDILSQFDAAMNVGIHFPVASHK